MTWNGLIASIVATWGPEDVASIEVTPVGLIKPYFRGVCLSRFTKANPNMTKMLLGFLADEAQDNDEGRTV